MAPHPITILTRAILILGVLVGGLLLFSAIKKKQKINALIQESQTLASDSSFFQQFYQEDTQKTLVRAIGLIAEANELGMPPTTFIDRTLGIDPGLFDEKPERDQEDPRQQLIRHTLSANYDNFRKLGYKADFQTIREMREGKLPAIPDGPSAGRTAEVAPIIDPAHSPGLEKVVANLQIRPPRDADKALDEIEIAAARRLANELANAGIIESQVANRLVKKISAPSSDEEDMQKDQD